MRYPLAPLALALLATACLTRPVGEVPDDDGGGTSTTTGDPTATSPTATLPPTTSQPTTVDPDTSTTATVGTTGDESTSTTGPVLGEGEPCDLEGWPEIPCAPGLKCMPYANDGGGFYNAAGCFPIDPDPVGLYEPCVWFDGTWSGYDNCGDHAFCEDWDGDGEGTCKGMCIWTEDDWDAFHCEDRTAVGSWACQSCFCTCETNCDPLDAQSCAEGEACYPLSHPDFGCAPDASGEMGAYGDECEFINVCDSGHFCANSELTAACAGSGLLGCCAAFCDLTQPNTCPGAAQGEFCQSWFSEGSDIPEGLENVGFCGLPQ